MSWPVLLEALEERTRRLAAAVETGGDVPAETALRADGPLPAELAMPARVLLAETLRLQELAERRHESVDRQLRYSRS